MNAKPIKDLAEDERNLMYQAMLRGMHVRERKVKKTGILEEVEKMRGQNAD